MGYFNGGDIYTTALHKLHCIILQDSPE